MGKGGSALKKLKENLKAAGIIGKNAPNSKKMDVLEKKKLKETLKDLSHKQQSDNPFEYKFTNDKFEVLGRKKTVGSVSKSRKNAIDQRKKTLLVEMKNRHKESVLVDKRIGENNPDMSIEDKMLQRMMMEKQKSSKSQVFNLETELTHHGQSLDTIDRFDEPLSESEDEGRMGEEMVAHHFGGFEETKKTRQQVMEEIIQKSKMHKKERQKMKEENMDILEEVDQELSTIRSLLEPISDATHKQVPYADYDMSVRELGYDRRSKPTDRTKTEEEIAMDEKKKLEQLEKQRLKRASNLPESGDGLDDDFDDDNSLDEEEGLSSEQETFEQDSESEQESEQEAEFELDQQGLESDEEHIVQGELKGEGELEPLPYTFEAPKDYSQFSSYVAGRPLQDHLTVVERLLVLYNPKLAPGNKTICAELLAILCQHIERSELSMYFLLHDIMVELGKKYPEQLGRFVLKYISEKRQKWDHSNKKEIPDIKLFMLLPDIYSASDLKHPIITPSFLFLCYLLNNGQEPKKQLLICDILYTFVHQSKRYIPEVIKHLHFLLKQETDYQEKVEATCTRFTKLYSDSPCILEIAQLLPNQVDDFILKSAKLKRKPLLLQKRKAVAIKTFAPKFHTNYSHDKHYDPDQERNASAKLKAQHRKEMRGAIRELRKDAAFVASEQLKKKRSDDQAYKKRMDKIMGELATQEGDMRSIKKPRK